MSSKKSSTKTINASNANNSPINGSVKSSEITNNLNSEKVEAPKVGTASPNESATKNEIQNNKQPNNGNPKTPNTKDMNQLGKSETAVGGKCLKSKDNGTTDKEDAKPEPIKVENDKEPPQKVKESTKIPAIDSSITTSESDIQSKDKENEEQVNDKNNNESLENKEISQIKSPVKKGNHDLKNNLRAEIWNKMFQSSVLAFRKPCNYRIPHFKGGLVSARLLSTLEIFQKAKIVKVILDKAHECVRRQVIEAGKEMIVGCPGLREAVFLHVKPPMVPSKFSNRVACSRIGIGHIGMALDFSSGTQADLVIVGSVAVDRTGLRVGKGEGFADLEYALLKKLCGIAPDAPIVTVVHDSQVYDRLPENLFKEHDVPADYIVTPREVIEVNPKRKHPNLIWNILSSRRVNSIPIIKQLLDREQNHDGATVTLKDEDTDSEELEQIAKRKRYFMRRRTYSSGSERGREQMVNRPNDTREGRIRHYSDPSGRIYQKPIMMPQFRPPAIFRSQTATVPQNNFNQQRNMNQNRYWAPRNFQNGGHRRRRLDMFRPRYSVNFSLKVQGLTKEMRVRDLKWAIKQRGIHASYISWLPRKGIAFLHFAKPKNNTSKPQQTISGTDANSVLASLKDVIVKAKNGSETNVKIEEAPPTRRVHFTL